MRGIEVNKSELREDPPLQQTASRSTVPLQVPLFNDFSTRWSQRDFAHIKRKPRDFGICSCT